MNELAPAGSVFVCLACGKRSQTKYGFISGPVPPGEYHTSYGWDESCMMNSEMFKESNLEMKGERVVKINDRQ